MDGMIKDIPGLDDPYVYSATLIRVIDGDTVRLKLWRPFKAEWDFGFYIKEEIDTVRSIEMNCRMLGINAPEIHGTTKEIIARGQASTVEFTRLLNLGKLRAKTAKPDKYGRWLADIWVTDGDGKVTHVNSWLVEHGFAVPYME
jgi:endonuclease YncB( thermonuclease family)